jgi:hypothetical protein
MLNRIIYVFLFSFTFSAISCQRSEKKEAKIDPSWHKLSLSNGWIIYAPPNFVSEAEQGVDSEPGIIYSKKDSIALQYDSGSNERNNRGCGLQLQLQDAKADLADFYKTFYKVPIVHKAYIDTIDNKIAIFLKPTKTGHGTVGIEILGCREGPWIGIDGTNLSSEKEELVLKMYKTIRHIKKRS